MKKPTVSLFWFRRDLRLEDNHGLSQALQGNYPVLPVFIYDSNITNELEQDDPRISFIYDQLKKMNLQLKQRQASVICLKGDPISIWKQLLTEYDVKEVYANEDYEPYAIQRDNDIRQLLNDFGKPFHLYKDQVIFAKNDILKSDNTPYTVFTPYKNKWLQAFDSSIVLQFYPITLGKLLHLKVSLPTMESLGFRRSKIKVIDYNLTDIGSYEKTRNYPYMDRTSYLSPHLRFGTVSIRSIINQAQKNATFLSELIWREFFMQILFHFPHVINSNFKRKYDFIEWRNDPEEFEKWKKGITGYPFVDAGMRQLNETGYLHNRARMIVAGFLCKHLLIDWRWGEAYFAQKLLDYELSSNNGNWQWAAGTGCDAAPYFRVFNPTSQVKKFDPELKYIKKWVPDFQTYDYPAPMVDHAAARERAITTFKKGLQNSKEEIHS